MILRRSMNSPAFLRNSQLSGCGDVIELYRKRAILFASGTQAATMVFRHKEFQKQLKSLGIDETQTRCARSVDELRCLNNSIKHSQRVNEELAKFPRWKNKKGDNLGNLESHYRRLRPVAERYLKDFSGRLDSM